MASQLPALLVEAFASAPLQGNGAAVVRLDQPAAAEWMQGLAGSLRQSETAFLHRNAAGFWRLRWFTPSCEVPLCGHATLAATLALAHWGALGPGQTLQLASRSGALDVSIPAQPDAVAGGWIASLVLPSSGLVTQPVPAGLNALIGAEVLAYWSSPLGYCVALVSPQLELAALPNPAPQLSPPESQGLVVMQAAASTTPQCLGAPCDYQLRFFAPGLGIDEDPVTGSAHALVAPWWMEQLGRSSVRGWQASRRRGGMLCESAGPGRVRLTGVGQLLWDGRINASGAGCDPISWDRAVHL
jgi:predicted PhzF superfamily epimerase YddE/YHI9